jgi:hypothetical protein
MTDIIAMHFHQSRLMPGVQDNTRLSFAGGSEPRKTLLVRIQFEPQIRHSVHENAGAGAHPDKIRSLLRRQSQ